MLRIYYADSTVFQEQFNLDKLLSFLPQSLHVRALRYRRPQDAFNFVLGKLMLKKGLEEFLLSSLVIRQDSRKYLVRVFCSAH